MCGAIPSVATGVAQKCPVVQKKMCLGAQKNKSVLAVALVASRPWPGWCPSCGLDAALVVAPVVSRLWPRWCFACGVVLFVVTDMAEKCPGVQNKKKGPGVQNKKNVPVFKNKSPGEKQKYPGLF